MKNKLLLEILGGFFGLVFGILIGGYIGLILGGTFLGGFDIHERLGIEGYEITTYIGAVIGGFIATPFGVKYALGNFYKPN